MKWEYRREPVHVDTWNIIGKEGWELVALENGFAYFKRPIKK